VNIRRCLRLVAPLALLCLSTSLKAQNVVRIEVWPIETLTVKTQQVLTGDQNGKSVTIAGELRISEARD
jgi:hypothetical protein